eukprot:GHVL01004431.1.p1 GENE.GHVL01004431.1~~GHVL01004431.1.p1  ORF type:complete len:103 (-),score=6.11 GHVL01004431.1:86-394(-)
MFIHDINAALILIIGMLSLFFNFYKMQGIYQICEFLHNYVDEQNVKYIFITRKYQLFDNFNIQIEHKNENFLKKKRFLEELLSITYVTHVLRMFLINKNCPF